MFPFLIFVLMAIPLVSPSPELWVEEENPEMYREECGKGVTIYCRVLISLFCEFFIYENLLVFFPLIEKLNV